MIVIRNNRLCIFVFLACATRVFANLEKSEDIGRSSSYNFLSMFGWPKNNGNNNNEQTPPCYTTTTPPPNLLPCPLSKPQQTEESEPQAPQTNPLPFIGQIPNGNRPNMNSPNSVPSSPNSSETKTLSQSLPQPAGFFGGPFFPNGGFANNNKLPVGNGVPMNEIYIPAQENSQEGRPAEGLIAFQPAGIHPGQIEVIDAKTGKPIFPWPAGLANQLQQFIPIPQLPGQSAAPNFPQVPNSPIPSNPSSPENLLPNITNNIPEMTPPQNILDITGIPNVPEIPTGNIPNMPNVSGVPTGIPNMPNVTGFPTGSVPNMPNVSGIPTGSLPDMPKIPGLEIPSSSNIGSPASMSSIPPGGSAQEPIPLPSVAMTSRYPTYIPFNKDPSHQGFLPIPPPGFMQQQYTEPSNNIPIINLPFPVNPIQTCTGLPPGPFTPPGFFHTDSKAQLQRSTEKCGLAPVTPVSCTMLQVFEQLRLRTIYNLIVKSGAELFFQESYNYTFFAPVDAAFDRLPAWFMQELQTDFLLQKAFIKNHFIKIDLPLESLGSEFLVLNLRGSRLRINIYNPDTDFKVYTVDGARILLGGVRTTNGLLHIVDKVLMPIPNRSQAQYLGEVKDFSNFLNIVTNAGMLPEFQDENPRTVFIPSDAAFKSFDLASISADPKALRNFVNYHVVNGTWFSSGLIHGQYLTTNYFKEIKMGISTDGFTKYAETVNGKIRIIKSDIPLLNGVAHIIENCITYDPNFFFYEELSEFTSEFSSFRRSMTLNKKELEKDKTILSKTEESE